MNPNTACCYYSGICMSIRMTSIRPLWRYFVGERLFELPDLKLLVDAVESSRFITAKKSERLIEKLGKLTSESHARQLDRHIYMEGTAKPENE